MRKSDSWQLVTKCGNPHILGNMLSNWWWMLTFWGEVITLLRTALMGSIITLGYTISNPPEKSWHESDPSPFCFVLTMPIFRKRLFLLVLAAKASPGTRVVVSWAFLIEPTWSGINNCMMTSGFQIHMVNGHPRNILDSSSSQVWRIVNIVPTKLQWYWVSANALFLHGM